MDAETKTYTLPVLPLRNAVLFPGTILPLMAGRDKSRAAVDAALQTEEKALILVAQRDAAVDDPSLYDLHAVGVRGLVRRAAHSDETVEIIVQGEERVRLLDLVTTHPYLKAVGRTVPLPQDSSAEVEAMHRTVLEQATRMLDLAGQGHVDLSQFARQAEEPLQLVYMLGSVLSLDTDRKQSLLEAERRLDALTLMHGSLTHEIQVLEVRNKIASETASEINKEQREYVLRQQMHAIQQELGESDEQGDLTTLREQLDQADLPDEVRKEADREFKRLQRMNRASPDHGITRSYLELVAELPWRKSTEDQLDLARARQILDEDHYGLKEVKERIREQLAVMQNNPEAHAPILCFVGPPGVGKTSLGQSIARALGRKFERASLGGVHDEAELRGHRRTYIGAMPGRLIQAIRRAGANNPVLMLDEVDKLGHGGFHGDPAAALLEVLDPAQNNTFRDTYLDMPFDLSRTLFIATANTLDTVPRPLIDRMEIIRLSGYSEEEKMQIARRYLLPRQIQETGLSDGQLVISDEVLRAIISRYTQEAGVRQLERTLARVARKVTLRRLEEGVERAEVTAEDLLDLLGPERRHAERAREQLQPGVAVGMAWTESGGEILYVEALRLPGARGLRLTGQLGEVMKESAHAARSYVLSKVAELGLGTAPEKVGIHVHVPAGATPKDGPSAGVAMAVALASAYTGLSARPDTSMTGEVTLTGLVLPVGGIKEKVLAARRAGIKRVLLPRDNVADLRDLPDEVRDDLEIVLLDRVGQALREAIPGLAERMLTEQPRPPLMPAA